MTTTSSEITVEHIAEINPDALLADGFDDAIEGLCLQFGQLPIVAYDYEKCINILIERDKMTRTEAKDYIDVNVIGAYLGPNSPVFIKK
jgi:hypothetical protein